jgi:hypothetical protein
MILATEKDLQCKHCGFIKDKLDLYCYFAWNDGFWSDLRHSAPNQAIPALVQYCPNCKRYYFIEVEGVMMKSTRDYNWIEPVEYDDIKPAVKEYAGFDWVLPVEFTHRHHLLWAYNDTFYRNYSTRIPTEADKEIARENLLRLAELYQDPIVVAEFLREAEMYKECLELAETIQPEGFEVVVLDRIITLAREGDNKPFKVEAE